MLNISPVVDEVTVIVPVATEHVGCVIFTVGAAGVTGCAFTVRGVAELIQPCAFFAVTE